MMPRVISETSGFSFVYAYNLMFTYTVIMRDNLFHIKKRICDTKKIVFHIGKRIKNMRHEKKLFQLFVFFCEKGKMSNTFDRV